MLKEFKEFLLKTNALALAVGVIIGGAVGKVVENAMTVGTFIGTVIDFIIIAAVVFLITKALLKPAPEAPAPPTKTCPECLEAIPLAAKRCRACGSSV